MRALAAAAVAALVLSACQDPAGVGLGLIDEEQLDPNTVPVAITDLALFNDSTVAIGIAQASNALAQPRVIAGAVEDPLFGDVRAVAYVDFLQGDVPDDASAADVSEAWLVLARNYAYGDTTTALPLELRQIQGDWEASRDYPPDTLFNVGPVLSTTTVTVADSLTRFDLPASWVSQNAGLLVGDDFADGFEGLSLSVPAGYTPAPGVAWGFRTYATAGSGLRVVVEDDTLTYALSEVFSSLDTEPPSVTDPALLPARSSSEAAVTFNADLAGVGTAALAQARLRLPLAASLETEGPFLRPIARRAFLFGIRGSGTDRTRSFLSELAIVDGQVTVASPATLTDSLQAVLLGSRSAFDGYELVPDPSQASLDVLPVRLPPTGDVDPRFTLTVVGAAQ